MDSLNCIWTGLSEDEWFSYGNTNRKTNNTKNYNKTSEFVCYDYKSSDIYSFTYY